MRPFRVEVPDAVLEDLRDRLARTRWPDQIPGSGWDYGTERGYLEELVAYWRDEYDWRRAEARLNTFEHFLTEIDGTRVHFLHARSPEPGALPLIVTHGWPGSVVEQLKIVDPLTNPAAHGGSASDAFHLVIPSLPGYGFSGKSAATGWGTDRIARAWAMLIERLEVPATCAGGDWGIGISADMARQARQGLAVFSLRRCQIAKNKNFRIVGNGQIGPYYDAAAAIRFRVGALGHPPAEFRRGYTARP